MAYVHPFLNLDPSAGDAARGEASATHNTLAESNVTPFPGTENRKDYFIERDGKRFAGTHLILDLWGASRLDEIEHIEETLRSAVTEAGATLLHIHLHHFTPNGGVSGVAVLAESHISIHTWPENDFAALDVFMCGAAEPHMTVEVLRGAFQPKHLEVHEYLRGEER